jgi:altronate dehydratase small subunit
MLTRKFIIVDVRDNVATSVQPLARGEALEMRECNPAGSLVINHDIPFGHKFALRAIGPGDPVIKYGETIGVASEAICPGDHVHVHNVEGVRGRGDRR